MSFDKKLFKRREFLGMDYEVAIALGYVTGPKLPKLSWWRIRWNRFLALVRPNNPPRVHYDRPSCDVLPENRSRLSPREAQELTALITASDLDWRTPPQYLGSPTPACDVLRKIEAEADAMVRKMTPERPEIGLAEQPEIDD